MALISPEQKFALWSILLLSSAYGLWIEKTRWGTKISGVVVTILATFTLSNLKVIPDQASTYNVVWNYLVPLAIPLLLFRADLWRIWQETGSTLVAYLVGLFGTVVGTVLAYYLIPLGESGRQLAGTFCAAYIGGSVNFAATAQTLDLRSGDLLSAGAAVNNLVMAGYLILLFSLPSITWIQKIFTTPDSEPKLRKKQVNFFDFEHKEELKILDISLSLAISGIACTLGYGFANWWGYPQAGIVGTTITMVIFATIFPHDLQNIVSAEQIGMFFMRIFFATIGASANIGVVFRVAPILFIFAAMIVLVHLVVLLIIGKILNLNLAELLIASNANLGGSTTAAAMAAARKWDNLVTPGILCGILGYVVATFIGVGLAQLLH